VTSAVLLEEDGADEGRVGIVTYFHCPAPEVVSPEPESAIVVSRFAESNQLKAVRRT